MRLAIMQPYLFPYIGYFQLMSAVDEFVVYDNIEFTKKGWINRNRILVNGQEAYITVPLRKDSDFLDVRERVLSDTWPIEKQRILNRLTESYRKAPYYKEVYPLVESSLGFEEMNLFKFILNSIALANDYLDIKTKLVVSSTIAVNHELKAEQKVLSICKVKNANVYINLPGGISLYDKDKFDAAGIRLLFIRPNEIRYRQFENEFIPRLSIIDTMMFNSKAEIKNMLNSFNLE